MFNFGEYCTGLIVLCSVMCPIIKMSTALKLGVMTIKYSIQLFLGVGSFLNTNVRCRTFSIWQISSLSEIFCYTNFVGFFSDLVVSEIFRQSNVGHFHVSRLSAILQ